MENHLTNDPAADSPNAQLATLVFQKLLEAGLVSDDGKADFLKKLAQGELRDSHWSVALQQVFHENSPADETPQT